MNRLIILSAAFFISLPFGGKLLAQHRTGESDAPQRVSTPIYFRIGESRIDTTFEGNRYRLMLFMDSLNKVLADSSYVVTRICVQGTSSPDGNKSRNLQLAGERAEALAGYVRSHAPQVADKVHSVNGGENWDGLRELIEASDMPDKEAMLRLMDRYADDRSACKRAMQYYDGSKPWLYMYEHFFPALRMGGGGIARSEAVPCRQDTVPQTGSQMSFDYVSKNGTESTAQTLREEQQTAPEGTGPVSAAPEVMSLSRQFHPLVALKTDLMLWGGVMPDFRMGTWTPNLSVELYFARRWSVQAGYAYSNWDAFSGDKELYALSVADLETRYWFGKPSLFKGLYLGVYGQYGQYDVQETVSGQTGSFWGAGLGAGWLQPLSKHWAVEAQIRGGYRSAQNELYDIEPGHDYFNAKTTEDKFSGQLRLLIVYRFGNPTK